MSQHPTNSFCYLRPQLRTSLTLTFSPFLHRIGDHFSLKCDSMQNFCHSYGRLRTSWYAMAWLSSWLEVTSFEEYSRSLCFWFQKLHSVHITCLIFLKFDTEKVRVDENDKYLIWSLLLVILGNKWYISSFKSKTNLPSDLYWAKCTTGNYWFFLILSVVPFLGTRGANANHPPLHCNYRGGARGGMV